MFIVMLNRVLKILLCLVLGLVALRYLLMIVLVLLELFGIPQ